MSADAARSMQMEPRSGSRKAIDKATRAFIEDELSVHNREYQKLLLAEEKVKREHEQSLKKRRGISYSKQTLLTKIKYFESVLGQKN